MQQLKNDDTNNLSFLTSERNMSDLLPANLQNTLQEIVERTNGAGGGIRLILISTAEGVPLGRIYAESEHSSPLNEDVLTDIESTWAPAAKQFPLLNMGKEVKIVTAIYDRGTIFHVYQAPVVVTLLVGTHANLGAVRSTAIPLLKQVLDPLCKTLINSLSPDGDAWQDAAADVAGYA